MACGCAAHQWRLLGSRLSCLRVPLSLGEADVLKMSPDPFHEMTLVSMLHALQLPRCLFAWYVELKLARSGLILKIFSAPTCFLGVAFPLDNKIELFTSHHIFRL